MEIVKQDLTVKTGAENMPCHLARPASGGPYPPIVVVMEAFGLNENIKNITDRCAAEGFVAISPNLYFRQPDNVVGFVRPLDPLPTGIRPPLILKCRNVVGLIGGHRTGSLS